MYTLRIIEEFKTSEKSPWQQSITNIELGNSYTLCKGAPTITPIKLDQKSDAVVSVENISSVIKGENGKEINILESSKNTNRLYFVLTECGTTFERIK